MAIDSAPSPMSDELRVLLLAPTRRDADAIGKILSNESINCIAFATMDALCGAIEAGVGAVMISEESLVEDHATLAACLNSRAVWSDVPILVLTCSGVEPPKLMQHIRELGNVALLERPVRINTLVSVVRSSLRARQRQYQVRDHLDERAQVERQRLQLLDAERSARSEAERAGRMKDEFLATLSHELRTPLNAVLGWSQLLAQGGLDAETTSEALRTIERNARAQTHIIEDLLEMSRIISGKIRLDVQPVNLALVIHEAMESVRLTADARGVRLQTSLDDPARTIAGDPSRLQQVIWNLLTNAIKFSPRGGIIHIRMEPRDSNVHISVIDQGEGVEAEFLPYVFDRFRQADASITRRHGGLGLGLAIVKQLIELHGGSVRVHSEGRGKGAMFTLILPLISSLAQVPPTTNGRQVPVKPTERRNEVCRSLDGVRIVVVDDEPDARALVCRILEDCKAIVKTAGSVSEAMDLVRRCPPDVLISDIGMPVEDGYGLIQRVRALKPDHLARIPAIALSAYARSEDRTRSMRAGYQMHIAKPVEADELITTVASLAGKPE